MERLFEIGKSWETASDRDRQYLKGFIGRLVGYPCKIACKDADDIIDVYVMSDRTGNVDDWIEIHVNGAVCPNDDMYIDKRKRVKDSVVTACDAHNQEYCVEPYPGESETDESEEEDETEEDESDDESSDEQSV
jgi:hypothetical protein